MEQSIALLDSSLDPQPVTKSRPPLDPASVDECALQPTTRHSRVAVCIPTYRREISLRCTIEALLTQDYAGEYVIVVADNDAAEQRGLSVARSIPAARPILGIVAPERGHAQARNAALAVTLQLRPPVDFVAMIDDDEVPSKNWLSLLVEAQRDFDADIVNGPVKGVFEREPAIWMVAGHFYDTLGIRRGPIRRPLAANNLMVRTDVLRTCHPDVFPPSLGLTGGEDTDFAYRVEALGFTTVWANDAVVFEKVFCSRMNKRWLLQRAYRTGLTNVLAQSKYQPGSAKAAMRTLKTCGLLLSSIFVLAFTWFDETRCLRAGLALARGVGKAAGHFGMAYHEYRATHGR